MAWRFLISSLFVGDKLPEFTPDVAAA